MTVIGSLGHPWRADVSPGGEVRPWDGSPSTSWWVAAEDRWHDPMSESGVRQHCVDGVPVVETRLRIPGGDVIARVGAAPDHAGLTVFEFRNESPAAIAVAVAGGHVLASRSTEPRPGPGAPPASDAVVVPVGHRAMATVVVAHDPQRCPSWPGDVPELDALVRGWVGATDRVSRISVAGDRVGEELRRVRSQWVLAPVDPSDDPVVVLGHLIERIAMGDSFGIWADEFAANLAAVVRTTTTRGPRRLSRRRRSTPLPGHHGILVRAAATLKAAGEDRAVGDLEAILAQVATGTPDAASTSLPTMAIEDRFARTLSGAGAVLMPEGLDPAWFGTAIEAHGLVVGGGRRLSYALRWHGERPAVLWEVTGGSDSSPWRVEGGGLDPHWSSTEVRGEALLGVPPGAEARRRELSEGDPPDPSTTAPVVSMLPPPRRR